MFSSRVTQMVRVALALVFVVAGFDQAAAASLSLSDVQVLIDDTLLTASVSATLEAQSGDGTAVYLDVLSVELSENGTPLDLFAGPTLLDDSPFLGLPFFLTDGEFLTNRLVFVITGLVPGASYAGSFSIQFSNYDPFTNDATLGSTLPERFAADIAAAPTAVPEPATMFLLATGLGVTGVVERRRKRRG